MRAVRGKHEYVHNIYSKRFCTNLTIVFTFKCKAGNNLSEIS